MVLSRAAVYILATRKNGTLYIGSTTHLRARVGRHRFGGGSLFTTKYAVRMLVYYEYHPDKRGSATRERQKKRWRRAWKIALIEQQNPAWRDLSLELDAPTC